MLKKIYKERDNSINQMWKRQPVWNKAILSAAVADGGVLIFTLASMFVNIPAFLPAVLVGAVYYGYVVIAQKRRLHFLRMLSLAGIGLSIATAAMFAFFESPMLIIVLFTAYGCIGVLWGLLLLQLRKEFKTLVIVLSVLSIITNGMYALLFFNPMLSIIGFYLSMPSTVIEIIFLVRAAKKN